MRHPMMRSRLLGVSLGVVAIGWLTGLSARQATGDVVAIDNDDIGGVVTGPAGPEAGVWVIAETTATQTPFARIVVTDDRGRYVVPDLPKVSFRVWVRGYGLADSARVTASPGQPLNLKVTNAASPRAAAEIYPAGYWFSLMQIPGKTEFPGTGPSGNGLSPNLTSQAQFLRNVKSGGCTACHQLGTKGTREIPKELGTFNSSMAAWDRRLQSG